MTPTVLILCIAHVVFWAVTILGPLFGPIRFAYTVGLIVVPFVFISYGLFPHCLLQHGKYIAAGSQEHGHKMSEDFNNKSVILYYFAKLQDKLEKHCFQSPISPQGLLLIASMICTVRISGQTPVTAS